MTLSSKYAWLYKEGAPKILVEALKTHGVKEVPGNADNPEILRWARVVGVEKIYTHDSIAWCGLAAAYWSVMAGYKPPKDPLWARNWLNWGTPVKTPMLGDIMVWERGTGGHVGMYVGEDDTCWHVLGGNQSDQVNIVRKAKAQPKGSQLLGARRSPFKIGQPPNVRRVRLSAVGTPVAGSEA